MHLFVTVASLIEEGQAAGFDAVPEYNLPWETRLFVFYLLFASLLTLVKSLGVARQLSWFSAKQASSEKQGTRLDGGFLAALALANRLSEPMGSSGSRRFEAHTAEVSLRLLRQAGSRFRYRWQKCSANVALLKRLVVLTLLTSFLMLIYGTTNTLIQIVNQKATGMVAISSSLAQALVLFVFGTFVCVIMYAASSICEGALTRRRIVWDYFCATIKEQSKTE
jgi:hypothetical protein